MVQLHQIYGDLARKQEQLGDFCAMVSTRYAPAPALAYVCFFLCLALLLLLLLLLLLIWLAHVAWLLPCAPQRDQLQALQGAPRPGQAPQGSDRARHGQALDHQLNKTHKRGY